MVFSIVHTIVVIYCIATPIPMKKCCIPSRNPILSSVYCDVYCLRGCVVCIVGVGGHYSFYKLC